MLAFKPYNLTSRSVLANLNALSKLDICQKKLSRVELDDKRSRWTTKMVKTPSFHLLNWKLYITDGQPK